MIIINGNEVETMDGETIMHVADRVGIKIPRMCHAEDLSTFSSCMVCQVRELNADVLLPACSSIAEDGMRIDTDSDFVVTARRTALELLLSEHLGDCEGPCRVFCPAGMDIPLMIRQIAAGDFLAALKTIKKDIVIPAVLGRICSAPCERVCRRSDYDDAVSICKLKRFVADWDLNRDSWVPNVITPRRGRVAVIGGGPMGLATAWNLALAGYGVSILDEHEKLGGALRYETSKDVLDPVILEREIETTLSIGIKFLPFTKLGTNVALDDLIESYDAVGVAFAPKSTQDATLMDLPVDVTDNRDKKFKTRIDKLFWEQVIDSKSRMAIRAVAKGKALAQSIMASLGDSDEDKRPFNSMLGKPKSEEMKIFVKDASKLTRVYVEDGFDAVAAVSEAKRCLRCDCRGKYECKLRDLATDANVNQKRFLAEDRANYEMKIPFENVIYESGKCIKCGICVRISEKAEMRGGFTFLERGYAVKIGTPFDCVISDEYRETVMECVRRCPTGALSFIESDLL